MLAAFAIAAALFRSASILLSKFTGPALDDGAWWIFDNDKQEATAGFFVAFTRAKQRVIFSYCGERGERTKITPLYELLKKAGVPTIKVG